MRAETFMQVLKTHLLHLNSKEQKTFKACFMKYCNILNNSYEIVAGFDQSVHSVHFVKNILDHFVHQ